MAQITITEALAEIKTLGKRIAAKQQFIMGNLGRMSVVLDPLAKEGGSEERLRQEIQSLGDLLKRIETIRVSIQKANQSNNLTVENETRSVAAWLAWRKECAPTHRALLQGISTTIQNSRAAIQKQALTNPTPASLLVHVSETWLAAELEKTEKILGTLDGKLSLFNATSTINI